MKKTFYPIVLTLLALCSVYPFVEILHHLSFLPDYSGNYLFLVVPFVVWEGIASGRFYRQKRFDGLEIFFQRIIEWGFLILVTSLS